MTTFQIILLSVLGATAAAIVTAAVRRRIGRIVALAWTAVLATGMVFAIEPDWTTAIARKVGINRGTDLVLYVLAVASIQGFLLLYLKLRRVRRELTLLVRELAIREAAARAHEDAGRAPEQPRDAR
ncbi:MAG: hypothetical protein RI967_1900 [Planctomycetota bacterium]|jgi:hypothetical protein